MADSNIAYEPDGIPRHQKSAHGAFWRCSRRTIIFTAKKRRSRPEIAPLIASRRGHAHRPDFGEARTAVIGGVEQKIHFLVMDLPHSDACRAEGVSG